MYAMKLQYCCNIIVMGYKICRYLCFDIFSVWRHNKCGLCSLGKMGSDKFWCWQNEYKKTERWHCANHIHTCTHKHIMCIPTFMYIYIHTNIHLCTYIYAYMYIHLYIYIHTPDGFLYFDYWPLGGANIDPRTILWTILVEIHLIILHAKWISIESYSFRREHFIMFFFM